MTENFPQPIEKQDMPRPTLPDNDQKKRVGRPRKTSVHTVASVPIRGPKKLIENMKRRRYDTQKLLQQIFFSYIFRQRDLNNIASQKCRAKKKEELLNSTKDCEYRVSTSILLNYNRIYTECINNKYIAGTKKQGT